MRFLGNRVLIPKDLFLSVHIFEFPHPRKSCSVISWFPGIDFSLATCLPIRFLVTANISLYYLHNYALEFQVVCFFHDYRLKICTHFCSLLCLQRLTHHLWLDRSEEYKYEAVPRDIFSVFTMLRLSHLCTVRTEEWSVSVWIYVFKIYSIIHTGFAFLKPVAMRSSVFSDVARCSPLKVTGHFGR
jgi:hypothetical protein